QKRYGPEYERALRDQRGDRRRAESILQRREERVARFPIQELTESERGRFIARWHSVQSLFVDDPRGAALAADRLVTDVMAASGYPMADFDQRASDLSVGHGRVVENYRRAHDTTVRSEHGQAETEEVRQALVSYRQLFEELVAPSKTTVARP